MDPYGFYRISAFVPVVKIADPFFNISKIYTAIIKAQQNNVDCIVFPELSITGYTCADLFNQKIVIQSAEKAVGELIHKTENLDILAVVGAPVLAFGKLFNCAISFSKGKILGIVPKTYLPNYGEFYEKRWFESGKKIKGETIFFASQKTPFGVDLMFNHKNVNMGIEICEDLWVPSPPSSSLAMAGAEVILNLSASDELIGKNNYILNLISQQSARCRCAYAYSSAGWGESSTDLVFSGNAIIGYDGNIVASSERFLISNFEVTADIDIQKLRLDRQKFNTFTESEIQEINYRKIISDYEKEYTEVKDIPVPNCLPFVPENKKKLHERCEEIISIQAYGLMKRLDAIGCKKAVIGISGGLDSTLALLVTVRAFDKLNLPRTGIIAVTMPGLATTSRTKNNALELMNLLGVTALQIPIKKAVDQHFKDIGQNPGKFDATYENSQARERTQILMDLANKEGGIVIGTGDMSELALGWCTYNGDQMSMYGVNASVPKTLVRYLVEWVASESDEKIKQVLKDICQTPISPELIPSGNEDITQKTEDLVGPYELHDFFLFHFLRNSFSPDKIFYLASLAFKDKYEKSIILKWLKVFFKRFFSQQFKRSCMPDGPKVGSVNLSPRGDWRMPSDVNPELWLNRLNSL
ncbi:MAG: NAD(+) synthase [Muribaculaceae bacterium]|nr:NAD(+) synthase [Muribaculaceae bacterium]